MISTLTINTPPTTGDLTLLATVKTELQVTGTADDVFLADLIRQASSTIASHCRRPEGFGRATVTQTVRLDVPLPPGRPIPLLRDLAPTIGTVTEDGTGLAASDWLLDGSLLHRLADDAPTSWSARKVVIGYSAGFVLLTDVPYDLERCAVDVVRHLWHARGRDPALRSMTVPDVIEQSWSVGTGDGFADGLPSDIKARLAPWVAWNV